VKKNLLLPLAIKWESSFLLFERAKSNHFGSFLKKIIFNSKFEKSCSHNLIKEEKNE
jgi:hypothetical protein